MKKELVNYLIETSGTLSTKMIIANMLMALILSACIYVSYKYSYAKIVYSARFNATLMIMTLLTALIMSCIGTNISLSLGMVGALSIVRFRTAIKDPRDTAYIFWAIAVGICCGVSDYFIAAMGTMFIFIVVLIIGNVQNNTRYLLVVRGSRSKTEEIEECINNYYGGAAIFRAKNTTKDKNELIYLISSNMIKNSEKKEKTISSLLYDIEGVNSVNIVSQNNEMNN